MQPKQNLSIPVAIIIAGAVIAVSVYISGRSSAQPAKAIAAPGTGAQQQASLDSIKPIQPTDHVLGNPKAKMVIVEYSDTECPFCKNFHNTLNQIITDYKGQVAWVFRHFPVHSKSVNEGTALECAAQVGGNDAFWKYTDMVFQSTNSNDSLDPSMLPQIAANIGLDAAKFNACMSNNKYESKIAQDKQDVVAAGAQGTPFSVIFVAGQKIPITQGAIPYAGMKNIIDTILKSS